VRFTLTPLDLPLVHTFTIARGSESVSRTAIARLEWRGLEGLGETTPSARYAESVESVLAHYAERSVTGEDPYRLEELLEGRPPAARCALDVALHDLIGKELDRPLWQPLGLDPRKTPLTSFTIGLDTIEAMLAKVDEIREHPTIKVKLGTAQDVEIVASIRERYTGALRIDANEAWTAEQATKTLNELERYDIEFCEQPIPAGTPERLRWITEQTDIPIVTDEDSQDARDVPALRGCVAGVNVKLVKCGGIRGALAMIHTARAAGLKIMLGCMVESAILATAAAHLSPLVDWADLDGPFLTKDDPFAGLTYERGKIVLPDGPGLGVRERALTAGA